MLYALLSVIAQIENKRGNQSTGRNRRHRRRPDNADEASETPNPDFDFGPSPDTLSLARPAAAERHFARVAVLLAILALVPLGAVVLALFWN